MLFCDNYINCGSGVLFFFLSRIYMFDSRSWLSTVVRENVSREKIDFFFLVLEKHPIFKKKLIQIFAC